MATYPEPVDPIDAEIERLFADPSVQRRLEDFEERRQRGELHLVPHKEVRRRLGLGLGLDPESPSA